MEHEAYWAWRLAYIERRIMRECLKPSELVRQIQEVFTDFDERGDKTWPLRTIRDHVVDYMRALSASNRDMSYEEVVMLSRFMLFEAAKRHEWHMSASDGALRSKYKLIIELCEAIEQGEQGICADAKLFEGGFLRLSKIREGYDGNPAYIWLKDPASLEGNYELATILREEHEQVTEVGLYIVNEWKKKTHELQQEAATEAQGTDENAMD